MALLLWKAGFRRVRPLEGGLEGWRALGYPLEPVLAAQVQAAAASGGDAIAS